MSFNLQLNAQSLPKDRSHFELNLGIGKRAYINSNKGILKGTFSTNYNWRIHEVIDLKTGIDVMYWDITYQPDKGIGYLNSGSSYEHFAYAFFTGIDFKMNKLLLQFGVGRYLYYKSIPNYNLKYYSKMGFKYMITDHLTAGFFLKAHSYEADYLDFSLGWKF